jgi:hypothetical protein
MWFRPKGFPFCPMSEINVEGDNSVRRAQGLSSRLCRAQARQ